MDIIKTGSHITRETTTFEGNNTRDIKDHYAKLPSGVVPMIFNFLLFFILLFCGLYIPNTRINWNSAFAIAAYCSFCISIIWAVWRQNFLEDIRYNLFSIWNKTIFYKIKNKIFNLQIDKKKDISNIDEFKKYLEKRKNNTKILFFVSFGIHLFLVIISTILVFVF